MFSISRRQVEGGAMILGIAALIFVAILVFKNSSGNTSGLLPLPEENLVLLTSEGFVPKETKIRVNSAVRWRNNLDADASVNSDNYPTNRLYTELNLGLFKSDQTIIHIFKKPGVYTYHDQFHPENKGSVTVYE